MAQSDLTWTPIALAGGLQDSKAQPEPTDLQELSNWALFRGRFALRAPLVETVTFVDDQVTPAAISQVLAIQYHVGKCYVVGCSVGQTDVYLYRLKADGTAEAADPQFPNASPITTIWASMSTIPRVTLTSFEGGSATGGLQRLYLADATGVYPTKYWDSTTPALVAVTEDFDDDNTKEALYFPLVFAYNDHLLGTNFYQYDTPNVTIPGLLRFSQPGLIPAAEPGVTYNALREWWFSDFRFVGSRGEGLICASDAGPVKVLFKRRRTYALEGYDLASFVLRRVDERVGAVGPHAAAALPNGRCLFWSDRGPYLTDGTQVADIGEMIRKRVNAVTFSNDVAIEYSPDDGLCYVMVADDGSAPYLRYAWDVARERWVDEGSWLVGSAATLRVNDLRAIPDDVLPGPAGPPTGVAVAVTSDVELGLTWTNGDTAIDVETDIYRHTSTGFTPGPTYFVGTVLSGVAAYADTGRSAKATYYYKLIARRNGQSSAASTEANGRTALAHPTGLTASSYPTGIQVKVTHNANLSDLVLQRKPAGGNWSTLTTYSAQASGVVTHNDTTTTCGQVYAYRAYAAEGGETNSPYSNEASWTACLTAPVLLTAAHKATIAVDCPTGPNVVVSWTGTGLKAGDTVLIERDEDGGGYAEIKTVSAQALSATDTWGRRSGVTDETLQYRLTPYDGGTVPGTPIETTLGHESVDSGVCPE
jgi:hypothetical protein